MARAVLEKTEQEKIQEQILALLVQAGGGVLGDDDILYEGKKFILPEGITLGEGIRFLERKQDELERVTDYDRTMKYRPLDGAYCCYNALKKAFGAVGHRSRTIQTMFGPMKAPPQMITVNIGVDQQEQIPWGNFEIPYLPGVEITVGEERHPELGPLFHLSAKGPKKFKSAIEGIFRLVEDELKTGSMYRGKAIDGQVQPEFIDVRGVDPERVVYSQEVMTQLRANVWSQIEHASEMRRLGIPLKRAVLVHGPYGTGKTLAAGLTAQIAVSTTPPWTYIGARPGRDDLEYVIQTARLYQPACVFYEDVDKVTDPAEVQGDDIVKLLDIFDGIKAKSTEILVVLTTNHADRIHKAMVRPGRLDAVIEINDLDAEGIKKLVISNTHESILQADDIDWEEVGRHSEGYKPAFVKELGDRAVRHMVARTDGQTKNVKLSTADLVGAADELKPQLEMMEGARDTVARDPISRSFRDIAATAASAAVRSHVREDVLNDEDEANEMMHDQLAKTNANGVVSTK